LETVVKLELSDSERRQYEDEGFFVRESIFDNADLERLRAAAERVVGTATRASLEVLESAGTSPEQPTESETDYQTGIATSRPRARRFNSNIDRVPRRFGSSNPSIISIRSSMIWSRIPGS